MARTRLQTILINVYLVVFFSYLLLPLIVMVAATFNTSHFPTIIPWSGTTLQWFNALVEDQQMWRGLQGSIIVGLAVVVIALPIGTLAALLLDGLNTRFRGVLYGMMIAPLLIPGLIVGISTLVFWNGLGVNAGLHLSALGQCSFITSYVMLLVFARMQRFDRTLEEAALDLGATHLQVLRRIILPFLRPSLITATFLAFLISFQDFNATLFTRGTGNTLTVYVASKLRTGVTPSLNALGFCMVSITIAAVIVYEIMRRRAERRRLLQEIDR